MFRAAALLALLCLAGAAKHRVPLPLFESQQSGPGQQLGQTESGKPFQKNTEYRFIYDLQIASGLIAPSDEDGVDPQQKAVTRMQCAAKLQFASDRHAQLQLKECRAGQQNEPMGRPEKVQPMGAFEPKTIPTEKKQQLELPCQFSYEDGVIERVQFHETDETWSKNIKRAVLNMIQMNLKRNNAQGLREGDELLEIDEDQREKGIEKQAQKFKQGKTFTVPEMTLEGACQTTYTIYARGGIEQQQQQQKFNVTKTINFKQCQKIADVAYGYQTQQQQAKCAQCHQYWAQQQGVQGPQKQQKVQNSEQHPCAKCDPKEVKEQELDRSTVIRCQIQGQPPLHKYALERCELLSQYVYRNGKMEDGKYGAAMHTVVSATLQARGNKADPEAQQIPSIASGKDETLMFSNDWDLDVKQFYMFGDDEFGAQSKDSPFAQVPTVQQAEQALRKLVQAMQDRQLGIEQQAPAQLQRLVEMQRMSTRAELSRIEQQTCGGGAAQQMNAQQKHQCKQINAQALATCGTRNCVGQLAHKIKTKELTQAESVKALVALSQLPAPSDPIIKEVLQLCTSEVVRAQAPVKQACWMTFGALVNELCQYRTEKNAAEKKANAQQSGFYREQQCPMDKKQQYKEAMLAVYQDSESIYDKMVALQSLGNAGLDICMGDLEQIIRDKREARVVRVKAIDALRRLRVQAPRRIQRVLVPIFQNYREHPQVRTAAFAIAMYTQPEPQVVDQLMAPIVRGEPNQQVRAFAYRTLRMMARSENPNNRKIALHIKSVLKLANVDEDKLFASGKWEVPLFDKELGEGVFATLATTISAQSALPVYAHAQLDAQFNEQFQLNQVKLYMMQQEAEQWYRKLVGGSKFGDKSKISRAQRQSHSAKPYGQSLRNIFQTLGIQKRRPSFSPYQQDFEQFSNDNEQQLNQQQQPFVMLCIRTNDVDRGFLALDGQIMSEQAHQILNGDQQMIRKSAQLAMALFGQEKIAQVQQLIGAVVANLNERQAKIPTSAGVPLRLLNSMPVLANIQGPVQINTANAQAVQLDTNMQIATCVAHIQKMECWTPFLVSGVKSFRLAEINAPLQAEISANLDQGSPTISAKVKLPQQKTQLAGAHSLPITYTANVDSRTGLVRDPSRMRAIHNAKLERQQREANTLVPGLKNIGMPVHIIGHFHCPSSPANFQQLVQMLMATENAVHVTYQPEEGSPKEAIFRLSAIHFQKASTGEHPQQLQDFYREQFSSAYECEPEQQCEELEKQRQEDAQEMEPEQERQQKLHTFIGQYKSSGEQYKHTLKMSVQTKGGAKQAQAQCEVQAQCDARMQYCKVQADAERTPMFEGEQGKWTLKAQAQLVMPETESSVAQLQQKQQQGEEDKKHKQFIGQAKAEWGPQGQQKQQISIRVHGTQAHTAQVRHILAEQKREGAELISAHQMHKLQRRTAFLNKYQLEAQYTLKARAQTLISRGLELLKSAYYWNTRSQLTGFGAQQNGKAVATIVIDPITQQHANVTIRTPAQQIRMDSIQLPTPMRPFPLIRQHSAQQTHTLGQLIGHFSVANRAECTADGKTVLTFDGSEYPAPLLSSCYSVLAKDCGSDQEPQFAVLMKKLPQDEQPDVEYPQDQYALKKLKVLTPEREIECQARKRQPTQLNCKINGETVDPEDPGQQQWVQYNDERRSDATIRAEGIAVRFNGRKAWLKVSPMYKNTACGLCGHYDESAQGEDEWRMADGRIATDLAKFHRSYALKDQQMCNQQELDSFYSEDKDKKGEYYRYQQRVQKPEFEDLYKSDQGEEYPAWKEEKFGGEYGNNDIGEVYFPYGSSQLNDIFGITGAQGQQRCCCCCAYSDTQCKQNCKQSCDQDWCEKCRPEKEKMEREQEMTASGDEYEKPCCCCCDDDDDQCKQDCKESRQCERKCVNDECKCGKGKGAEAQCQFGKVSPVWKTKVQEQNHAVCFSTKPVKECPRGSVTADSDDEDEKEKSVHFACVDRADPQARRLLRQLRQGQRVVQVPQARGGTSYTERVREPRQCRQFRGRY